MNSVKKSIFCSCCFFYISIPSVLTMKMEWQKFKLKMVKFYENMILDVTLRVFFPENLLFEFGQYAYWDIFWALYCTHAFYANRSYIARYLSGKIKPLPPGMKFSHILHVTMNFSERRNCKIHIEIIRCSDDLFAIFLYAYACQGKWWEFSGSLSKGPLSFFKN